jgi:hypothetical protein
MLPAAPPPVESIVAVRPEALHSAGPVGVDTAGAAAAEVVAVAGREAAGWLAELAELAGEDAGAVEVWACGVPVPQPARKSAAAAAAVVSTSLFVNR